MSEVEEIKGRLADHTKLAKVIRQVFYSSPLEDATMNLAAAIERHALGLPIISVDQAMRLYLNTLTAEERATWWKAKNSEGSQP